ncbi:MAG: putative rRNA maturation factor, partial [Gammaproteobacteria bacterium]
AREVSQRRGVSFERELLLYVVHGTLHLCGFDDHEPEDRAEMRLAEAAVMSSLGYAADTAPHDL